MLQYAYFFISYIIFIINQDIISTSYQGWEQWVFFEMKIRDKDKGAHSGRLGVSAWVDQSKNGRLSMPSVRAGLK
jgi:hypothetical protein